MSNNLNYQVFGNFQLLYSRYVWFFLKKLFFKEGLLKKLLLKELICIWFEYIKSNLLKVSWENYFLKELIFI